MTLRRIVMALVFASALLAATRAGAQQLYWLDTRFAAPTLNRANPDGTSPHSLALPAGSLPEGLALDPVHHRLYWTEAAFGGARVRSCGLDFSFPADVYTGGSALRGLAVDGTGGRLYWTTSNMVAGPTIRRANLDGSGLTTIVSLAGASNPRGVAFTAATAPPALYACDAGTDALYRYDVNGVGALLLGLSPGARPYGVAVDGVSGRVYFTEYGLNRIERCEATGIGRAMLLGGLANPTYIALDVPGGSLYWVEGGAASQRVMRATLTGGVPANLGLPVTTYGGIVFAPASQIVGVDEPRVRELALGAISPNPAFGQTKVEFALPSAVRVRLSVFDLQGREIAVLVDGVQEAGRHVAVVEAGAMRAGIYMVRMRAGGMNLTRRLVLVK